MQKSEPIDELKLILYPEGLEMSNMISILNEDLSFTIADFYKLKEVQKLYLTKEQLVSDLGNINFIKVEGEKVKYVLCDTLAYFNFLNIPGKLTKDEILNVLKLDENKDKYLRFYKKYLYWQLVSEDLNFCDSFEKTLKYIKFTENANIRYEYLPQSLKSTIIKRVQRTIYNKEASDLKATTTDKQVNQTSNYSSNDSSSLGWRKKSNDLTTSASNELNRGGNKVVNPRFNDNLGGKSTSFNDVPIKRERFNSDGDKVYNNQNNCKPISQFSYQSVFQNNNFKLDYSKLNVNYNTEIKHKYNNKELCDLYEKLTGGITKTPEFSLFVEDVCMENKKTNIQMLARPRMYSEDIKKDRSKTFSELQPNSFNSQNKSCFNYANSNSANVSSKVPRNNPLQDMKYNPTSLFK